MRDNFVPEVDILEEQSESGAKRPKMTDSRERPANTLNTIRGLGDNVKEYKSMNLRLPFKECSLYRFEGSASNDRKPHRTLKTAQRKDETKNE